MSHLLLGFDTTSALPLRLGLLTAVLDKYFQKQVTDLTHIFFLVVNLAHYS